MKSKRVAAYLDTLPLAYQGYEFIHIIEEAVEVAEAEMEESMEALRLDNECWKKALSEAKARLEIAEKVIADKNRK